MSYWVICVLTWRGDEEIHANYHESKSIVLDTGNRLLGNEILRAGEDIVPVQNWQPVMGDVEVASHGAHDVNTSGIENVIDDARQGCLRSVSIINKGTLPRARCPEQGALAGRGHVQRAEAAQDNQCIGRELGDGRNLAQSSLISRLVCTLDNSPCEALAFCTRPSEQKGTGRTPRSENSWG